MTSATWSGGCNPFQPQVSRSVTSLGSRHALPLFTGHHEWIIQYFAERNDLPGVSLNTRFTIPVTDHEGNKAITVWRIKLYPNGCDLENANYLSLFINQVSGPSFHVRYTFSMNGIPPYSTTPVAQHIRSGTVQFIGDKRTSSRGWKRYISVEAVKNNPTFTQYSNLVIACKLELEFRDNTAQQPRLSSPSSMSCSLLPSSSSSSSLSTSFSAPSSSKDEFDLNDIKYTDLVLICGDRQFKCHKFMMAKYSDVFDAMFSHDFEETKSNRVVISDLDPEAVAEMIRFVYSGTVKGMKKINKNLMVAADKYNIRALKSACEKSLCAGMNKDNVCSLLMFANSRLSEFLKSEAVSFITHNISEVTKTPGWSELFTDHQLVTEIIREMGPKSLLRN